MGALSRHLPPGATPAQVRAAKNRRRRVLEFVLETVMFSQPPARAQHVQRKRMDWTARRDGLGNKEFRRRYKLTKEAFADMCQELRPALEPPTGTTNPISTELALSMTLRFLAGGHVLDIIDQHGCAEPTFYHKLWQVGGVCVRVPRMLPSFTHTMLQYPAHLGWNWCCVHVT